MTVDHGNKGADGLQYNRKGYLIPPQSDGAWSWLAVIYAMVIPFIVTKSLVQSPFRPIILPKFALFQLMVSRNLLSVDQIATAELLLAILFIARILAFPSFFRKCASKYSDQCLPPEALRRLWPAQIRGRFYVTAVLLGAPLLSGVVMQRGILSDYMKVREASFEIMVFGIGIWFLVESIFAVALFSFFYVRYWRHSPLVA